MTSPPARRQSGCTGSSDHREHPANHDAPIDFSNPNRRTIEMRALMTALVADV